MPNQQITANDILDTVKRISPERAAKLAALQHQSRKENAGKPKEAINPMANVPANASINEEDLKKAMEFMNQVDAEAGVKATALVKDEKPEKEITEQDLIAQEKKMLMEEINKDNFCDPRYIDFFRELPFNKQLELLNITPYQAAVFCDQSITKGYFEWNFKIRSINVKLVSREVDIYMRTLDKLEEKQHSRLRIMETMSMYNTAGSLVKLGDREFPLYRDIPKEKKAEYLESKVDFVKGLNSAVYTRLTRETAKLDLLTSLLSSEEALENLPIGPGEQDE